MLTEQLRSCVIRQFAVSNSQTQQNKASIFPGRKEVHSKRQLAAGKPYILKFMICSLQRSRCRGHSRSYLGDISWK
jgi:hypothetical protein